MKNRIGLIVLTVACVALLVALIVSNKNAATQREADRSSIQTFSNQVVSVGLNLREQQQVNTELEKSIATQKQSFVELTNNFTQLSGELEKSSAALKSAQQDIAARDAKIVDLQAQNQSLNQTAEELGLAITNLNVQITETQKKLASSEGDKAFLQKELQRLMSEKADLERQFNDLAILKTQVAKLREALALSRRLDWIRRGIYASSEQKGAERLQNLNTTPTFSSAAGGTNETAAPNPSKNYDLNVEVYSDGSVHVIPPPTNSPATNQ